MKKSILLFVMLALCGAVIFAGGGGEAAPAASGAAASSGAVQTLTILNSRNVPQDGHDLIWAALERKSNIRLEREIRIGGAEGETIVKTRLAAGDMTDIFEYNVGSKTNDLNPALNCVDLTSAFASKLNPSFVTSASADGKLYAVPLDFSAQGGLMWYNKKIYAELGLQIPKTWQEFIANCEKVQAAGHTAILGTFKDTWSSQFYVLSDNYYVKKAMPDWPQQYTGNKAKFATFPAAQRGFEKTAESAKYFNKDYLATTLMQGIEKMATGETVHFCMHSHRLSIMAVNFPESVPNIGFYALPGDNANDQGLTVWMPNGLYIYKNTQKQDAARQALDYMLTQEAYTMYTSKIQPGGPPVVNGLKLPTNAMPAILEMQKYFDTGKIEPALEFESPVKGPNLEQLCIEVATGRMTPAQAAAAYDQDVQKQAVLLNLPGWN